MIKVEAEHAGFLYGHSGIVTSIVAGHAGPNETTDTVLVSSSRDKSIIVWDLTTKAEAHHYGEPKRSLTGHNHFVTDLSLLNDNAYAISSSWDKTLRLWDLRNFKCTRIFNKHEKEVESVCFSSDSCKIFSGAHDNKVFLWNTKGEVKKESSSQHCHRDWVTKVRYSASTKNDYCATAGRDGRLKIWNGSLNCIASIKAHNNYINALALSLNGQYIVTGGKDNSIKVWDYNDLSKPHIEYKTESEINDLAFNLQYQLVAVATDKCFKIYDIMSKKGEPLLSVVPEQIPDSDLKNGIRTNVRCTSIAWSSNLKKIYVGCSDGHIRVYNINFQGGNN